MDRTFARSRADWGPERVLRVTARFPARPEGLAEVHAALDRFFDQSEAKVRRIAPADRVAIVTAAGEVAANIVEHACGAVPDAHVQMVVHGHVDHIEVAFEDPGAPYVVPAPSAEDLLPQGGMGLMVAHAAVDTLQYVRAGDRNHWRLVRRTRARSAVS
jgi:anti-sigma regulatory factor (Ser/Thr protein kinase)